MFHCFMLFIKTHSTPFSPSSSIQIPPLHKARPSPLHVPWEIPCHDVTPCHVVLHTLIYLTSIILPSLPLMVPYMAGQNALSHYDSQKYLDCCSFWLQLGHTPHVAGHIPTRLSCTLHPSLPTSPSNHHVSDMYSCLNHFRGACIYLRKHLGSTLAFIMQSVWALSL